MSKKMLFSLLGLLVLGGGIAAGVYLSQNTQLLEKSASVTSGTATARLSPSTISAPIDDVFSMDLLIDTGTIPISVANFTIEFPYSGTTPPASVSVEPNTDLIDDFSWKYAEAAFSYEDGTATISLRTSNSILEGFAANGETRLATIRFKAQENATITMEFNPTLSQIFSKDESPRDILGPLPAPAGTITIGTGGNPSASPTPTISLQPTASPTPTSGAGTGGGGGNSDPTNTPTPTSSTQVTGTPTSTSTPAPTSTTMTTATATATTSVNVGSPTNGAQLTDTTPTFSGTAAAGASVSVAITGAGTANGTTTANSNGAWSWTPSTALAGGSYIATITATSNGTTTTDTVNFSITTTTGDTTLPQAGSITTTFVVLIGGLLFLIGGFVLSQ